MTVRLSRQMEEELTAFCQQKRLSKSQVVKEALAIYTERNAVSTSPYELGVDLFGQAGSDRTDGSITYKERLMLMLREEHPH